MGKGHNDCPPKLWHSFPSNFDGGKNDTRSRGKKIVFLEMVRQFSNGQRGKGSALVGGPICESAPYVNVNEDPSGAAVSSIDGSGVHLGIDREFYNEAME